MKYQPHKEQPSQSHDRRDFLRIAGLTVKTLGVGAVMSACNSRITGSANMIPIPQTGQPSLPESQGAGLPAVDPELTRAKEVLSKTVKPLSVKALDALDRQLAISPGAMSYASYGVSGQVDNGRGDVGFTYDAKSRQLDVIAQDRGAVPTASGDHVVTVSYIVSPDHSAAMVANILGGNSVDIASIETIVIDPTTIVWGVMATNNTLPPNSPDGSHTDAAYTLDTDYGQSPASIAALTQAVTTAAHEINFLN